MLVVQVKSGKIFAKIDQRDGMVIFEEDKQLQDSADMLARLNTEIYAATKLSTRLQDIDAEVSSHKGYLQKTCSNSQGKTPGQGWAGAEDVIF